MPWYWQLANHLLSWICHFLAVANCSFLIVSLIINIILRTILNYYWLTGTCERLSPVHATCSYLIIKSHMLKSRKIAATPCWINIHSWGYEFCCFVQVATFRFYQNNLPPVSRVESYFYGCFCHRYCCSYVMFACIPLYNICVFRSIFVTFILQEHKIRYTVNPLLMITDNLTM